MHRKKNEFDDQNHYDLKDDPHDDEKIIGNNTRSIGRNQAPSSTLAWYSPARLKFLDRRSNAENIPIALGFALMGTWFYMLSLEPLNGESDDKLIKSVIAVARNAFFSLIAYDVAYLTCLKLNGRITKLCTAAAITACLYWTVTYEMGMSNLYHGGVNILILFYVGGVLNLLGGVVYVLWNYRAWKKVLGCFIVFCVIMSFVALNARISYGQGILGERMQFESEGCTLSPMTPWVDLLPRRYFNFFTGSESCHKWRYQPFSQLKQGYLTIHCPEGNPYYVINPNFTRTPYPTWHEGERVDTNDLSRSWYHVSPQNVHRRYEGPVKITEGEYLSAYCGDKEEYHVQNVAIPQVKERAKQRHQKRSGKDDPNILFIILDSVSRRHFIRRLPETVNALESLKTFEVFQFFKYNSLACCTPTNMRSIVFGLTSRDEIKATSPGELLIWKPFEDAGYVSLWLNDLCQDYFKMYFSMPNGSFTDHEAVYPFCHYEFNLDKDPRSLAKPFAVEKRCIGDNYVHSHAFRYTLQFFDNYHDVPKFAVTKYIEAHENSGTVLSTLDDDMSQFVRILTTKHPNTIISFVGDHGLHVGPYGLSPQGDVENALPVLLTVFPSSLLQAHPEMREALKHNEHSLTTHLDLHKTILHTLNYPEYSGPTYASSTVYANHARSLYEKIPYSRDCAAAGIPDKMCRCKKK